MAENGAFKKGIFSAFARGKREKKKKAIKTKDGVTCGSKTTVLVDGFCYVLFSDAKL